MILLAKVLQLICSIDIFGWPWPDVKFWPCPFKVIMSLYIYMGIWQILWRYESYYFYWSGTRYLAPHSKHYGPGKQVLQTFMLSCPTKAQRAGLGTEGCQLGWESRWNWWPKYFCYQHSLVTNFGNQNIWSRIPPGSGTADPNWQPSVPSPPLCTFAGQDSMKVKARPNWQPLVPSPALCAFVG